MDSTKAPVLIFISMLVISGIPISERVSAYSEDVMAETVLLPEWDLLNEGWGTSDGGVLYDDIDDIGGAYLYVPSGTYKKYCANMTDFTATGYDNESYRIILKIYARSTVSIIGKMLMGIATSVSNWYDFSECRKAWQPANSYTYYYASIWGNTWTNASWTVSDINSIYYWFACGGNNLVRVDYFAVIVQSIVITENFNNAVILGGIFAIVGCAIIALMFVNRDNHV